MVLPAGAKEGGPDRATLADVGAPQEIVESTHAVPAIAVALDDKVMLSIVAGFAVLGPQQIDENVESACALRAACHGAKDASSLPGRRW